MLEISYDRIGWEQATDYGENHKNLHVALVLEDRERELSTHLVHSLKELTSTKIAVADESKCAD